MNITNEYDGRHALWVNGLHIGATQSVVRIGGGSGSVIAVIDPIRILNPIFVTDVFSLAFQIS
jgi:hypothetical protein